MAKREKAACTTDKQIAENLGHCLEDGVHHYVKLYR